MSDQHFLEELRLYLTMLHRRRALVVTCVLVSLLTAGLYNYTARPLYQATAQLLIEPQPPNVLPGRESAAEALGADFYQTQYELLRGRALVERVIERLDLGNSSELMAGPLRSPWEMLREKLGRKAPAVDATGAPLSPPLEAFRSRLTIEPLAGSRLINLRFAAYDPGVAARAVNALAQAARFTNQIVAYNASPGVFVQRSYLETLSRGSSTNSPKFFLGATNTDDVLILNLEQKVRADLLDLSIPGKK
jgi:uncharacterized protein involved in exopolysaccharide biosynthesis